jgi:hypothetical protein
VSRHPNSREGSEPAGGVVVLGMHRSGTSAATRLISMLGPRLPREDNLVPPSEKNRKGYWESMTLVALNERLLAALGSDMRCPALLEPGWEHDRRLAAVRGEAGSAFRATFSAAPWVWKDPRNCLTFAFWWTVLDSRPVVVLVNRNPLEIVASTLRAGRADGKIYLLALWERYLRQALDQIGGVPVLVTRYDTLLADPLGWCETARVFLAMARLPVAAPNALEVEAFVDRGLRHAASAREDFLADGDVSAQQRELFLALERAEGSQASFVRPDLPPETPSTEPLLAERRRVLQLEWQLASARRHPAVHLQRVYARLRALGRDAS